MIAPNASRLSPLALVIALAPLASAAQNATPDADPQQHNRTLISEELVVVGQPLDSLMDSDDIERKQANDLDDIFSGVSSVLVGGSVGAAQKIYVRNLGEDTLNIMVDGATQSGVTYHHTGRISVEPELLKQVRVQVGAGDATNGPGALGGAIRFETKDPEDLLGSDNFGALLKTGYFSNTEGTKNSATVYGRFNDTLSAMASYVDADQDNMEDAKGNELPGTNSDQGLGFVKLVGDLGAGHRLSLSHERLTEEGEKLTRPEWGEGPFNPLRELEFERETSTLKYQWDAPGNKALLVDANVYATEFNIYRPWDNYTSTVDTQGFTLGNTSKLAGHSVEYGVDYRDDEVTAGEADAANPFTETSEVLGLFVQDRYQATDRLLLSFGTRYDEFEAVDKEGNEFTEEGFSPNLGFSFEATRRLTISGGYAEALRGVETNDGFKLFGTTNDPDLKAERAKNLEFGADYELGRFMFSAGVHDVTIEDAIGNAVPWSRHYENLGDLESEGYTLGLTYSGQRLFSKWTFLDTTAEIDGEQVTRYSYGYLGTSTGDTLSIDTSYQITDGLDAGWIATLVEGMDDIYVVAADATVDKPGYGVHDFYLHWEPRVSENLSMTLTVKNAFNKQYLDHGSIEDFTHVPDYDGIVGYPAPGRDVRLSLALRF
ncbi:hemoglobin/transferrin/lactoferrin receptor protein [Marinimicrobium koreense]|uniref:Hemoglobin/transferrin/lactoferrin receptor protein n=1 Tax=Marinimicrobium koreense TaxID=306545 RepID=A0A3N1NTR9_9GAMM|nr:TonB-dependent receptor [Marinimicrobium koreense]ROQ18578.1 hemoglobin/transferrin/lactoferrin receptor protein [Marinimicrobium koreense]